MNAKELAVAEKSGVILNPFTPIQLVLDRALHSRDDNYSNSRYAYQLYMAGDKDAIQDMIRDNAISTGSGPNPDMPDYKHIQPQVGPMGLQNHPLVNSKIFIESIVYVEPEFNVESNNWLLREFNIAWLKKRAKQGDWGSTWFQMGMEVEAAGMSFCEVMFDESGRVTIEHRPILDMMWDRVNRSPSQWRYFFTRVRMSIDAAVEMFPNVGRERIEELATEVATDSPSQLQGTEQSQGEAGKILIVWRYWDQNSHACFLGSIASDNEVCSLGPDNQYTEEGIGPNPWGVIPMAWWIDAWCPSFFRPVGKAETTFRQASMLNTLEWQMRETLRRGIGLNFVSGQIGQEALDDMRDKDIDDLEAFIPVEDIEDIRKAVFRMPPSEVPQTALAFRQSLREELNASTGVMDAQRGQPLPGEKTALEVRTLNSSQGVQAQHARRQFAALWSRVIFLARTMGAMAERTNEQFYFRQDLVYDTNFMPYKSLLAADVEIYPHESSMMMKTEGDRRREAAEDLAALYMPGIKLGVMDPYKVYQLTLSKAGIRPETVMVGEDQWMLRQKMQAMLAAQGGQADGAPSQDKQEAPQGQNT